MKYKFEEYYIPKPEDIKRIWANSIVVLDANVLLSLYRYSSRTRNKLLALMNKYKDKLWLPHQVGLEFYRNRLKVIDDSERAYDNIYSLIDKSIVDLSEKIKKQYVRHP